jgi:UDPglucose--hexose-1-phosphate uridylyltransferase
MNESEMRLDPLRETWTVFSAARLSKPPSSALEKIASGSFSPFAAGNERFSPPPIFSVAEGAGWKVRVVPNRAPALRVEGDTQRHAEGFYDRMDAIGAHEVIVENPGSETLEELPLPAIAEVINVWKSRMVDLLRDVRLRAFFVVKDVGELAGAQVTHAVSQLIAMGVVPGPLLQKLKVARDFYERKKRSIFEDILHEEVRAAARLVYENNGFAAFCPYASRAPFEIAIYPKRQCADFHGVSDQEIVQLADALKTTLRKLARALDGPAYHLMLITAPTRTGRRDHWNTLDADFRWHIEIVPQLHPRSGFELGTGCFLNTVWPETAADYLRKTEL